MVCWGVRGWAIGSRVVRGGGVVDSVMDRVVDQLVRPYDSGNKDEEGACNLEWRRS